MKTSAAGAVVIMCVLALASAQALAATKYDEVSQVMKSIFSGGDLSPTSPAVKHATDVDMPARGGTPQALKQYLLKPEVKKWYQDRFQLK